MTKNRSLDFYYGKALYRFRRNFYSSRCNHLQARPFSSLLNSAPSPLWQPLDLEAQNEVRLTTSSLFYFTISFAWRSIPTACIRRQDDSAHAWIAFHPLDSTTQTCNIHHRPRQQRAGTFTPVGISLAAFSYCIRNPHAQKRTRIFWELHASIVAPHFEISCTRVCFAFRWSLAETLFLPQSQSIRFFRYFELE